MVSCISKTQSVLLVIRCSRPCPPPLPSVPPPPPRGGPHARGDARLQVKNHYRDPRLPVFFSAAYPIHFYRFSSAAVYPAIRPFCFPPSAVCYAGIGLPTGEEWISGMLFVSFLSFSKLGSG